MCSKCFHVAYNRAQSCSVYTSIIHAQQMLVSNLYGYQQKTMLLFPNDYCILFTMFYPTCVYCTIHTDNNDNIHTYKLPHIQLPHLLYTSCMSPELLNRCHVCSTDIYSFIPTSMAISHFVCDNCFCVRLVEGVHHTVN